VRVSDVFGVGEGEVGGGFAGVDGGVLDEGESFGVFFYGDVASSEIYASESSMYHIKLTW
jgi:hypothetical protein